MVGARSIYKVGFPIQALQSLQDQGVIPRADKVAPAPTGFFSSYTLPNITATSVADATSQLKNIIANRGLDITFQALPKKQSLFQEIVGTVGALFSFTSPTGALTATASGLAAQEPATGANTVANFRGGNMGLFDDIWGAVGQAGQSIFGGTQNTIDWNGLLNQGVGLATQALAPRSTAMAPAPMQTSLAGAVPMAARAGAVVARGFFNRFPNLATAIQTLRNSGMNVTRAKLYGVMKRFGPEFLVTGGLLTAAAVNELAVAGPGYRRMNPANVRALRRSVRRIESFHRLCKTTDRLRGSSRRRKAHC